MAKQTQNLKPVQGLSTTLKEADFADRSDGVILIMGNGSDIQKKDTGCGSNGLKPLIIYDEGSEEGTFEATAGVLNLTTTRRNTGVNSRDFKCGCISNPPCTMEDQESLRKQGQCLSDLSNNVILPRHFSQPSENDDNRTNKTCDNIDTLTFYSERGDVEPSTGSSSEKTKDAANKSRNRPGIKLNFLCNLFTF